MRILTVYAHPDDESFGPAGALAKYAQQDAELLGIWFTRGEAGETYLNPAPTPRELALLRTDDLKQATALIGYSATELLNYPDGGLAATPENELDGVVRAAIIRYQPTVIITFGPGGVSGHPDHITLSRVVTRVFHAAKAQHLGVQALYYDAVAPAEAAEYNLTALPDGNPNTFIETAETRAVHLAALGAHARHMADAREFLARLEQNPWQPAPFYRAWPPVPAGTTMEELSL